jgi:hypothetical protein
VYHAASRRQAELLVPRNALAFCALARYVFGRPDCKQKTAGVCPCCAISGSLSSKPMRLRTAGMLLVSIPAVHVLIRGRSFLRSIWRHASAAFSFNADRDWLQKQCEATRNSSARPESPNVSEARTLVEMCRVNCSSRPPASIVFAQMAWYACSRAL